MRLGRMIESRRLWAAAIGWMLLCPHSAMAMTIKQMRVLAGTGLLDLRVGTALHDCGLPSAILDSKAVSPGAHEIHWQDVKMQLSPGDWKMIYRRWQDVALHGSGWINQESGSVACLGNLSELIVHAKDNVGYLSVKKKADNQFGYRTTYRIPRDPYTAHQVIGITGRWEKGMPIAKIRKQYGKPDEILDKGDGIKYYRYWIVVKNKEWMPIYLYAVDFEVTDTKKTCTTYAIQSNGAGFVQDKLDAMERQWEREYVLD